jgi:hypothetical protein
MAITSQSGGGDVGFSIRCPHCFAWSDWEESIEDYIVSDSEWQEIENALRTKPDELPHAKTLRCKHHPGGDCPVTFYAFVCDKDSTAHQRRTSVPSWTPRHAFRVPKLDHETRHERSAVLFTIRPVERNKHIQLDALLDHDLLSRSVLGMSLELNAPITIFAPHFSKNGNASGEVWVPIEAYDHDQRPVPPHFNPFCEICREAFSAQLIDDCRNGECPRGRGEMEDDESECDCRPLPGTQQRKNWTRCRSFLAMRSKHCLCYGSDSRIIAELKEKWSSGSHLANTWHPARCWAGLEERAIPIVVHGHLAGIAMTGQFMLRENLKDFDIESIIEKDPTLRPHRQRLRGIWSSMTEKAGPQNESERSTLQFVIDGAELGEVEERFAANIQRIADSANIRYQHNRARREAAFREEMLGRIATVENSSDPHELLLTLIERMRRFWAFNGVQWFTWNGGTQWLTLVAQSSKPDGAAFMNQPICQIDYTLDDVNCHPWVYDRSSKKDQAVEHTNPWIQRFAGVFENSLPALLPEIAAVEEASHLFVFIKHGWAVHAIVFAQRDESEVSPLRPTYKGGISLICQHAIADTCEAVVRGLIAKGTLELLQWQRKILTFDAIGTTIVHELRPRLGEAWERVEEAINSNASLTKGDLEEILKAIGASVDVIASANRFKRNKKIKYEDVEVKKLVDKCMVNTRFPSRGIDKFDLEIPETATVWADAFLLSVAVGNLLKNIRDQNKETNADKVSKVSVLYKALEGERCILTIADDGPGFSPAALAGFYALQNGGFVCTDFDNTGLGLLITKAILDLHSGEMRVRNDSSGRGAIIEIELQKSKPTQGEVVK